MELTNEPKTSDYLKEHIEEVLEQVNTSGPMVITKNGEASAVVISYNEYKRIEDGKALKKFLDMRSKSAAEGKRIPIDEAFIDIKRHIEKFKERITENVK